MTRPLTLVIALVASLLGLALAAAFVPPLIARIHSEEALLAKHFGAEYDAYRARTWRLIPYVY